MRRLPHVAQLMFILMVVGFARAESPMPDDPAPTVRGTTTVASAYLQAMEAGDLEAAGALFAAPSSVFESGGHEGDWQSYVEHHIGPELKQIKTFIIKRGEPEVQQSTDQSMAFVAWPIEYTITLQDERVIDSRGTVTFVLVNGDDGFRIRHLHWSSRRKPAVNDQ